MTNGFNRPVVTCRRFSRRFSLLGDCGQLPARTVGRFANTRGAGPAPPTMPEDVEIASDDESEGADLMDLMEPEVYVDVYGFTWMYADLCGFMWMYVDVCGCMWMYVDLCIWRALGCR